MAKIVTKAPQFNKLSGPSKKESWDNRPSLSFDEMQLPEAKKWSVGDKCILTIETIMTENSILDYPEEKKGKQGFRFKVIGVSNHEMNENPTEEKKEEKK
jgi:hypothetical protein